MFYSSSARSRGVTCSKILLISITLLTFSCSNSSFSGSAHNKKAPDNAESKQVTSDPPQASPTTPPQNLEVKDECKEKKTLPTSLTQLVQLYNWHATGAHSAFSNVVATPVAGILKKGDTSPTIVVPGFETCLGDASQPAYLFAINGKDGTQKWESPMQVRAWLSAAIGDLDGDGNLEIVAVGTDNKVHALNADGKLVWSSDETVFDGPTIRWPTGLAVGDLEQNGKTAVVAGYKILSGNTGKLKFALPQSNGFLALANTDAIPGLEIVTNLGVYSGNSGTVICNFPQPIEDPAIAQFQSTDKNSSIVGIAGKNVVIYDGKTCVERARVIKPAAGGGPINIADFNGDGILDFGSAGKDFYMAFSLQGLLWQKPTQDRSSETTGSTTFDFNGDGKSEVVYADEIKLRIFDGSSGEQIYEAPHSSYTARENPIIVDIDGNGTANIVVGANSCQGREFSGVRAFKAPEDDWVNTRPIWNQHAYNPLIVRDDGGLSNINAKQIYEPWLKSAHLTGFRNNIPQPRKSECK